MSSRQFNQDIGGAKRAASNEPVVITDRGQPSHVLMTHNHYLAISGGDQSLFEAAKGLVKQAPLAKALQDFEVPKLDFDTQAVQLND